MHTEAVHLSRVGASRRPPPFIGPNRAVDDLSVTVESKAPEDGRRLRILFVDDEPLVLRGLERSLGAQRDAWEMSFADGGEAALALCASPQGFDAVVSDIRMPGIDGVALLREVRARMPRTVRIALTGHADQDEALVGLVHGFLAKPCDPRELRTVIETTCGGERA
jgi:YesN/AraC family two-component response regulator